MSALFESLRQRIERDGPLTVAQYMAEVLTHPAKGYYTTRDPFGADGDFVTAPEISQMFGELLGLWCAEAWQRLGQPTPIMLVELGPGRGTLMQDALRAARIVPGFREAMNIHLVEVSPALRRIQAETLDAVHGLNWHTDITGLPDGPALFLANEFFDALPVRQFEKTPEGWSERLVGYDPASDRLTFALARPDREAEAHVPSALRNAQAGAVVEVSPGTRAIAQDIGRRIATDGGAALAIDYGYAGPEGRPTLQALHRHTPADVLNDPGTADLTAHVDFSALAAAFAAGGAAVHGPVEQSTFLKALGLAERATILQRGATADQAGRIDAARKRLTGPDAMGALFKAMSAVPSDFGVPAGFPEAES